MSKPATTPPVHEAAQRRDWPAYFDRIEGKPPRDTLARALDLFDKEPTDRPRLAADIGCGSGRDAALILERGWTLWAADGSTDGIERAKNRPEIQTALADNRATLNVTDYADMTIPSADLVNASFSLPFCPPDQWDTLWNKIDAAIKPGARFSGQFFGDRDSWSIMEDRTHLTRPQTLALFDQYIIEHLQEEDRPSTSINEAHKHWHVFHIVARKRHTQGNA